MEIRLFYGLFRKIKQLLIPSKENNYELGLFKGRALFYLLGLILMAQIVLVISVSFPLPRNVFFANIVKSELLNILNRDRDRLGLNALQESEKLDQAALLKAKDMIAQNYFSHQSPQGLTPWFWFSKAGYVYKYAGENLAVGFLDSETLYNAWFNSPLHKDNLLNPNYKEIGMAILSGFGDNNAIVVVQLFGNPSAPVPAPAQPKTVKAGKPLPSPGIETTSQAAIEEITETKVLSEESKKTVKNNAPDTSYNLGLKKYFAFVLQQAKLLQYGFYGLLALFSCYFCLNIIISLKNHDKKITFKPLVFIFMVISSIILNYQLINKVAGQII